MPPSKSGVLGLVKALGKEVAKYDIAVNAITPAVANTAILKEVTKEFIEYMLSRIPRDRASSRWMSSPTWSPGW